MNMENLPALFENGAYTLVVQKGGVTVHKEFGRGVGPALRVFDAQPELLKGALVCETKTEKLLNRQGTGLCPFEQAVLELERPEDCLPVVRATLARLMAGKNNK